MRSQQAVHLAFRKNICPRLMPATGIRSRYLLWFYHSTTSTIACQGPSWRFGRRRRARGESAIISVGHAPQAQLDERVAGAPEPPSRCNRVGLCPSECTRAWRVASTSCRRPTKRGRPWHFVRQRGSTGPHRSGGLAVARSERTGRPRVTSVPPPKPPF